MTKAAIIDLSRFYHLSLGLDAKAAASKATNEMINDCYFSLFDNLQVPKQIIAGAGIHNLNKDYIKENLLQTRRNLLKGNIPFDYEATFGKEMEDTDGKITNMRNQRLASGRWFISPDQKSVYYAYLTDDGGYQPLMQSNDKALLFNLDELNAPYDNFITEEIAAEIFLSPYYDNHLLMK